MPHAPLAQALAGFAAGLALEGVPASTRERAKLLVLDALGVALASASFEFGRRAVEGLSALESGNAPVIGFSARLAVRDAILANGILTHGIDYDDTSIAARIHPGSVCMPVAMTLGTHLGRTGAEILVAYIAGMESAMRVGAVAPGRAKERGFYPTGVVGTFGAALIAGRLLGLDQAQLAAAQGIAYSTASGNQAFTAEMAWTKRMHPGWAGVGGVTAALLAKGGYVGPSEPYEGKFGFYRVYAGADADADNLARASADLGTRWEIDQVSVKPLPACYFSIAAIDAAAGLAREHGLEASGIEKVRVLLPAAAVETVCEPSRVRRRPADPYAAIFSIYYGVAVALARRKYTLADLEPAALEDPEVLALAQRVEYEIDPKTTFPRYYSGGVVVVTRDGRTLERREDVHRGAAERPLLWEEIVRKFTSNATRVLDAARAERVCEAVLGLERVTDTQALAPLLAPA